MTRALLRTATGAIIIVLLALLAWPHLSNEASQQTNKATTAHTDEIANELARVREALANTEAERQRLRQALAESEERERNLEGKRRLQLWFEDAKMLQYRSPWSPR